MNFYIDNIYAIDFTLMPQDDIEQVFEFRNHKDISKWMYSEKISYKTHLNFINNLKENHNSYYWLFKENSDLLGVGSLTRFNLTHKHSYIGIYKNPFLKNVGDKILSSLEYIAFKEFRLKTLHLEVMESNKKAIKFYQKHSYIYEGKLFDFILKNNSYENVLIYGKRNANE